jgi:quercetin dioxygenase-like cupin family protein
LGCENAGVTYYRLEPDFHPPFGHKHNVQEEVYVVLSGSARLKVDDEEIELGPLDAIRLSPDTTRALKAGPDGCEVLAYGAPKTASQDAEVLPGWWEG